MEESIGVGLTETLAMLPAASVSGLYFAGKSSQYFAVGKIDEEQAKSYAARKGWSIEEAYRHLAPTLSFEP